MFQSGFSMESRITILLVWNVLSGVIDAQHIGHNPMSLLSPTPPVRLTVDRMFMPQLQGQQGMLLPNAAGLMGGAAHRIHAINRAIAARQMGALGGVQSIAALRAQLQARQNVARAGFPTQVPGVMAASNGRGGAQNQNTGAATGGRSETANNNPRFIAAVDNVPQRNANNRQSGRNVPNSQNNRNNNPPANDVNVPGVHDGSQFISFESPIPNEGSRPSHMNEFGPSRHSDRGGGGRSRDNPRNDFGPSHTDFGPNDNNFGPNDNHRPPRDQGNNEFRNSRRDFGNNRNNVDRMRSSQDGPQELQTHFTSFNDRGSRDPFRRNNGNDMGPSRRNRVHSMELANQHVSRNRQRIQSPARDPSHDTPEINFSRMDNIFSRFGFSSGSLLEQQLTPRDEGQPGDQFSDSQNRNQPTSRNNNPDFRHDRNSNPDFRHGRSNNPDFRHDRIHNDPDFRHDRNHPDFRQDRHHNDPDFRHDRNSHPDFRNERNQNGPDFRHDRNQNGPDFRHDRNHNDPDFRHNRNDRNPDFRHDRNHNNPDFRQDRNRNSDFQRDRHNNNPDFNNDRFNRNNDFRQNGPDFRHDRNNNPDFRSDRNNHNPDFRNNNPDFHHDQGNNNNNNNNRDIGPDGPRSNSQGARNQQSMDISPARSNPISLIQRVLGPNSFPAQLLAGNPGMMRNIPIPFPGMGNGMNALRTGMGHLNRIHMG